MKNYQGIEIIKRTAHNLTYHIDQEVLDELETQLESAYPQEDCGFLFGYEEQERRYFKRLYPVENVFQGDKKRHFEIHPLAFQRAERKAEEEGLALLGIYHSHPDHPSMPSQTDLSIAMPYLSYLIASIRQGSMNSVQTWRLTEDRSAFIEETFIKNR